MSFDLVGCSQRCFRLLTVQLQVHLLFIIYVMETGKETWRTRFSICSMLTCFAICCVFY